MESFSVHEETKKDKCEPAKFSLWKKLQLSSFFFFFNLEREKERGVAEGKRES